MVLFEHCVGKCCDMITFNSFDSREELDLRLSNRLETDLNKAISINNSASCLVSGGVTPKSLYKTLAARNMLDWQNLTLGLVDERWVEADDLASNEGLIRKTLLSDCNDSVPFIGMKTEHDMPIEAEYLVAERYRELVPDPDLILLGMGTDGHTASWFSGSPQLPRVLSPENDKFCCAVYVPKKVSRDYPYRMTVTLSLILRAQQIILLITGENKRAVYENVKLAADYKHFPVAAVLNQRSVSVDVYWSP